MNRTIEPKLTLPRVDANEAHALGESLITAMQAEKRLPGPLAKEAKRLKEAHAAVASAASSAVVSVDRKEVRKIGLAEVSAWSSLHGLVAAWAALSGDEALLEKIAEARRLESMLFPNRLKFTRLPYRRMWAEGEHRLTRIVEEDLEAPIQRLGGGEMLESIRRRHQAFGEALGIKRVLEVPGESPSMRDLLADFSEAVRDYALQVNAYARLNQGDARRLADRLLAPLARWGSVRPRPQAEPQPIAAPAPAITPPPVSNS